MTSVSNTCHLYLISPPHIALTAFSTALENALSTDKDVVGAFQLRLKDASDDTISQAIETLMPLCHAHEVVFILNDRPDLAAQHRCDGIHLGQEDLTQWPLTRVRKMLGDDAVIGVSCHDSRHLAMSAGEQGADYVAFGAFYPTKSKSPEKLAQYGTPTPELIEWWTTYTTLPCVAIGGMTPENCLPMVHAGADFIAAITNIWEHPSGEAAAITAFNNAFTQNVT